MAEPVVAPAAAPRPRGRLVLSVAAGLIGGLLAPLVYPALARNARPLARRAMKAGIAAFENARVAAAELGEQAGDLMAEARAEYDEERQAPTGGEPAAAIVALRGSGREAAGS